MTYEFLQALREIRVAHLTPRNQWEELKTVERTALSPQEVLVGKSLKLREIEVPIRIEDRSYRIFAARGIMCV